MGFRFNFDEGVVSERGGIYVYSSIPGTEVYINDELEDVAGTFNREYFSQSERPGRYTISARQDGYRSWQKYIEVNAQRVSSVYPFLVPEEFEFIEVPETVADSLDNSTTTVEVANPDYQRYLSLFEVEEVATSTEDIILEEPDVIHRVFGDIQIWHEDNKFYAEWLPRGDFLPAYFCENGQCQNPFVFLEVNSEVTRFDFYPGRDDVVIFATQDGRIHAVEIDKRPEQTLVEIYNGGDVDFGISGRDIIIIKDGEKIITTEVVN